MQFCLSCFLLILCCFLLAFPGSNIKYPVMWNCDLRSYKDNKLASEPCIFKTCSLPQALTFDILHSDEAKSRFLESRMSFRGGNSTSGWGSAVGHLETVHSRLQTACFAWLPHTHFVRQDPIPGILGNPEKKKSRSQESCCALESSLRSICELIYVELRYKGVRTKGSHAHE